MAVHGLAMFSYYSMMNKFFRRLSMQYLSVKAYFWSDHEELERESMGSEML